jgi:hypothetical protein
MLMHFIIWVLWNYSWKLWLFITSAPVNCLPCPYTFDVAVVAA